MRALAASHVAACEPLARVQVAVVSLPAPSSHREFFLLSFPIDPMSPSSPSPPSFSTPATVLPRAETRFQDELGRLSSLPFFWHRQAHGAA
jgi:hypothetical protein